MNITRIAAPARLEAACHTISLLTLYNGSMHLEKSAEKRLHGLDEPKGSCVPRNLAFHLGNACGSPKRRSDRDGLLNATESEMHGLPRVSSHCCIKGRFALREGKLHSHNDIKCASRLAVVLIRRSQS